MEFEWDRGKAQANRRKHGVDFADAVEVFWDRRALTISDKHPTEERYVTVGSDTLGRILAVAYCWRGKDIRIISARRATASERQTYSEKR